MRNSINRNEVMKNAMKVAKRITITILICIPFLIVFAYLTRNVITSDALQIVCFIVVMAVAVLVEEIIVRKNEKRKAALQEIEGKKDVFK